MQLQVLLLVLRLCVVGVGMYLGDLLLTIILFGSLNFLFISFLFAEF